MITKNILLTITSLLLIFFTVQINAQIIVINEFMSDNESTLQDREGEYVDWIELYNKEDYPVVLKDYALSDNGRNLRKWLFPYVIIPSHGYLLVYASGKNRTDVEELHTNFKISADGEELFLTNNKGILIDQTDSEFLSADESFGRYPDGSNFWLKTFNSSPGISNNAVNHLLFSAEEGFYNSPFYLNIHSLMNDTVYYTLDGSEPTINSSVYFDSLFFDYRYNDPNYFSEIPSTPDQSLISYKAWESPNSLLHKAHILRCASFRNGIRTSKVYSHTYFVDNTISTKYNHPVISLVTEEANLFDYATGIYVPGKHFSSSNPEWTGNYFQDGIEWERPVHITYFEQGGKKCFSQDAGIRIHGYKSCQAAQKSLRLYARKEYGAENFHYQLLPQKENDEYKRFILRATMGDWWNSSMIRDVLAHDLARNLNLEYQDFRPVVVYLNGEYWGIYTIRDRIDERYISYLYGYDKDSVDMIEGNPFMVNSGSNEHYLRLAGFINLNDLKYAENYEYVKTQIDIDNVIDYYIAETFFANVDWPFNNQRLWRPQKPDGKWRWIFFDLDAGFGDVNTEMIPHSLTYAGLEWDEMSAFTFIIKNLLRNESFVQKFLERYAEVLNQDFKHELMIEKLNKIKDLYEPEIPAHISRWNFPESLSEWHRTIENSLAEFLNERPCTVEKNMLEYFNISNFGFKCPTSSPGTGLTHNHLLLGPNPSKGSFFLTNQSHDIILDNILIADLSGRIIFSEGKVHLFAGEKKQINLNGVPAGIYYLKCKCGNQVESKSLVILP